MKDKKPSIHAEKCLWWYDRHPSGPIDEKLRFFARDISWVSRLHEGSVEDFKYLCDKGWHSEDRVVRSQSYYSIPAMLKVQHLIREKNVEVSEEERMANVELIKALTEQVKKGFIQGGRNESL